MQKMICPKCGKIMQCKGTGGNKKKYMYYHCTDCRIYLREDLIEEQVMLMIMNLIEYDMTVKKYFYPVLADKKEQDTAKLDKEISSLRNQKSRIKDAYLKGIVDVEKEKLICSNKFYDMLMAEWKNKSKEEKQEFISKFLESIIVEKDEKGNYKIINIKLRKTFLEQIYKLMKNGMFDITIPDEKDKEVRTTVMMDKKELQE